MTPQPSPPARPLRVEILGVAGAGKSTLARAACAGRPGWLVADSLHTRLPAHLRYVAVAAPDVLRLAAGAARTGGRPSWSELKWAVYVGAWPRYLAERADAGAQVVLLDQGPLFTLARFRCEPSALARAAAFPRWWADAGRKWADELDGVVWLDAPDEVLLARIDGRDRAHEMKGQPRAEACAFLDGYRRALTDVVAAVRTDADVGLLTIDTARMDAQQSEAATVAWLSLRQGLRGMAVTVP